MKQQQNTKRAFSSVDIFGRTWYNKYNLHSLAILFKLHESARKLLWSFVCTVCLPMVMKVLQGADTIPYLLLPQKCWRNFIIILFVNVLLVLSLSCTLWFIKPICKQKPTHFTIYHQSLISCPGFDSWRSQEFFQTTFPLTHFPLTLLKLRPIAETILTLTAKSTCKPSRSSDFFESDHLSQHLRTGNFSI